MGRGSATWRPDGPRIPVDRFDDPFEESFRTYRSGKSYNLEGIYLCKWKWKSSLTCEFCVQHLRWFLAVVSHLLLVGWLQTGGLSKPWWSGRFLGHLEHRLRGISFCKHLGRRLRATAPRFHPEKEAYGSITITPWLISDLHLIFMLAVHSSASPAMSAANKVVESSSDVLPFRQGALDAEEIRAECPQFRILIIGKANAGKTTILRKMCNAKPDAKLIIYDANGKEVKVRLGNLAVMAKTNQNRRHRHDSHNCSRRLRFFDRQKDILQIFSTLLWRLGRL